MMSILNKRVRTAFLLGGAFIYGCGGSGPGAETGPVAVLVEGTGVYSRPVSTES